MAKRDNEIISKITPVSITKNFIQPTMITDEYVTFPCFKFVEVETTVISGKDKKDKKTDLDRYPLMLAWDGENLTWAIAQKGQEIVIGKEHHIIDRFIDDNPSLPSDKFVTKLMNNFIRKKMMDEFTPQEFFKEIHDYFERYFYLEKSYLRKILTLFVVNVWVFDAHDSTPYVFVRSPMRGCGKSNLGTSIADMCNGFMIVNPNAVHIFRMSHGTKTTLVFDEIKRLTASKMKLSQDDLDILSLINSGFQKYGPKVPRATEVTIGGVKTYRIDLYSGYTPKVLITTDGILPSDTMSRCIDIRMQMAPQNTDYDERWNEPERLERLQKIREMGLLFRFKYGSEIFKISKNPEWIRELDTSKLFKNIKNRDLEIFRPLIILTLKYMPLWKEGVEKYVRKNIEMKKDFEPTDVHVILLTIKDIYNDLVGCTYQVIESPEFGSVSIEDSEHGAVMLVPPKYIAERAEQRTEYPMFGKRPESVIGKKLNELGFITPDNKKKRNNLGRIRVIKISQLEEVLDRYLGVGLRESIGEQSLSQVEKIGLVRDILLENPKGLTPDELFSEIDSRMTEEEMMMVLRHLREIGSVMQRGKVLQWVE